MIDIHLHGTPEKDTHSKSPEDILEIARFHGLIGVSHIVPTIYPSSIEQMRAEMDLVRRAMRQQRETSSAWIVGVHLEGPFLNPKMSGALDNRAFLKPSQYYLERLIDGYEDIIKIITIAPELDGAIGLIKYLADTSIVVSMGHSDATYSEAEEGYRAGAKGITHLFNAMRGFHHREPGLSGFGLINKDIYVEVIADPYHLHTETIKLIFNLKPPERVILISDFVRVPRSQDGRLMGGTISLKESVERLISLGIDREKISLSVYQNPKRYLGID